MDYFIIIFFQGGIGSFWFLGTGEFPVPGSVRFGSVPRDII